MLRLVLTKELAEARAPTFEPQPVFPSPDRARAPSHHERCGSVRRIDRERVEHDRWSAVLLFGPPRSVREYPVAHRPATLSGAFLSPLQKALQRRDRNRTGM